jgi:hypothetical protein
MLRYAAVCPPTLACAIFAAQHNHGSGLGTQVYQHDNATVDPRTLEAVTGRMAVVLGSDEPRGAASQTIRGGVWHRSVQPFGR